MARKQQQHINVRNLIALQIAHEAGAALSPEEMHVLRSTWQIRKRWQNRQRRFSDRERRHASWPYCGNRARERYGRQVADGRLKAENGLAA